MLQHVTKILVKSQQSKQSLFQASTVQIVKKKLQSIMASQTAPAVPTSDGTSETSVDGISGPISQIQQKVIPGQELVSRCGQSNRLDVYLYEQFLTVATLVWSTSQLPGTVLWSTPLHPSRMNSVVAYLSKVYNSWGGGFQFKMKIAGTGFHAGALMMVRLPPNIHPTSIKTVQQASAFEWELFDPKTLTCETRTLIDQRRLGYHWGSELDESNPDSFGGYLMIMVNMQLQTSSTGLNQINVQLFNRLDPTFAVGQIIPPSIAEVQFPVVDQLIDELNGLRTNPLVTGPVSTLKVLPVNLTACTYAMRSLSGRMFDQNYSVVTPFAPEWFAYVVDTTNQRKVIAQMAEGLLWNEPIKSTVLDQRRPLSMNIIATRGRADTKSMPLQGTATLCTTSGDVAPILSTNFSFSSPENWPNGTSRYYTNPSGFTLTQETNLAFTPLYNESPLLFHYQSTSPYEMLVDVAAATTTEVSEFLRLNPLQLAPGTGLLFTLRDRETDLPVRYVKMYHAGAFYTNNSTAIIDYPSEKYYFEFESYIQDSDTIPAAPTFLVNDLLTRSMNKVKITEEV